MRHDPLQVWLEPMVPRDELYAALSRLFKVPRHEVWDMYGTRKRADLLVHCAWQPRGFLSEVAVEVNERRVGVRLDALGLARGLTRLLGVRGLVAPPDGGPGNDWLLVYPDGRMFLALQRSPWDDDEEFPDNSVILDPKHEPVPCDGATGAPLACVPWRADSMSPEACWARLVDIELELPVPEYPDPRSLIEAIAEEPYGWDRLIQRFGRSMKDEVIEPLIERLEQLASAEPDAQVALLVWQAMRELRTDSLLCRESLLVALEGLADSGALRDLDENELYEILLDAIALRRGYDATVVPVVVTLFGDGTLDRLSAEQLEDLRDRLSPFRRPGDSLREFFGEGSRPLKRAT